MIPALRACLVAFWIALAVWLSSLVTAAISAAMVFGRLPETPLTLERFAAYPAGEHGRIAAGQVMSDIFFTVDVMQFIAIPLTIVTLALQLAVFGMPWRRPANLVRAACLLAGALLFAWYAIRLAPALNGELRAFWAAAESGDVAAAERHREVFAADHVTASTILQANLLLVLVGIAASAVAVVPTGDRQPHLDTPRLATRP